jgi:hypothetical protein
MALLDKEMAAYGDKTPLTVPRPAPAAWSPPVKIAKPAKTGKSPPDRK